MKVDWEKIKAEYIAGSISQRKLAQKYKVNESTLQSRVKRGGWSKERREVARLCAKNAIEMTAKAASENAVLAEEIKRKGLQTVNRLLDQFNELNSTEHRDIKKSKGQMTVDIKRLKDITAAFKDLTDDMPKESNAEPVRIVIDV